MTERNLGVSIDVRRDVVMYHTVLCVGADRNPVAVAITTNPLEHRHYAQVVMHKTRSHPCAVQVARYVRRRFGIEEPVATHRAVRPVEAMIGYACAGGLQHSPDDRTPGWGVFQHIAATPIADLLREVTGGHNAARTRYVVYEVRDTTGYRMRGVTNKYDALERRYREAPPDSLQPGAQFVQVGRYATAEEAEAQLTAGGYAGDHLWRRRPSPEYIRRILRIDGDEIVWACDGAQAVRRHYAAPTVCIGPHAYTEYQIRGVLEHGAWPANGNSKDGRRAMYGG